MLGRVKVRIVGWYTGTGGQSYLDQIPTEDLPWAVVMLPTDQAGIKNTGTKTELQVGAQVLGFFLDGEEAQLPVVMGSLRGFRGQSDPKQGDDSATSEEGISPTTIADHRGTHRGGDARNCQGCQGAGLSIRVTVSL